MAAGLVDFALAAGLVDFALGTDTSGSIGVPASYCGVHGLRPTHGAIPLDGVVPLAPSFDTVGWLARDAPMLARCGRVLLGRLLAEIPLPATAGGAPMTYMAGGKQYVAVPIGGALPKS